MLRMIRYWKYMKYLYSIVNIASKIWDCVYLADYLEPDKN